MASSSTSPSSSRKKADARKSTSGPSFTGRSKPGGKKPLPEPIHLGNFLMMLVLKMCRAILFVDTSVKIGVYLIGVMMGSVICDLFSFPKTFLANSRNPLNQYFVKMGWGWTFTFVSAYIFLTSLVYCCRDLKRICQHMARIAVGTFWWYVCTSLFVHIEKVVGVCTMAGHADKSACLSAGKSWLGFDISGHVFLEIHCLLIISEEVKSFKEWKKLGKILEDVDLKERRKVSEEEILQAQMNFKTVLPLIKILIICLTVIVLLFEFMLFVSTVYRFHTLSQKVTASFVALICWFLSYRVIFRTGHPFSFMPVMPGHSPLSFMKIL